MTENIGGILDMVADMETIETLLGRKGRFVGDMVHISIADLAACIRKKDLSPAQGAGCQAGTQGDQEKIANMAILIRRLCNAIKEPKTVKDQARDYLKRHGLQGTPCRTEIADAAPPGANMRGSVEEVSIWGAFDNAFIDLERAVDKKLRPYKESYKGLEPEIMAIVNLIFKVIAEKYPNGLKIITGGEL